MSKPRRRAMVRLVSRAISTGTIKFVPVRFHAPHDWFCQRIRRSVPAFLPWHEAIVSRLQRLPYSLGPAAAVTTRTTEGRTAPCGT